jgi:hypothetical protein
MSGCVDRQAHVLAQLSNTVAAERISENGESYVEQCQLRCHRMNPIVRGLVCAAWRFDVFAHVGGLPKMVKSG